MGETIIGRLRVEMLVRPAKKNCGGSRKPKQKNDQPRPGPLQTPMLENHRRDKEQMRENGVCEEVDGGGLLLKLLPEALDGLSVEVVAKKLFNHLLALARVELS